jgi:hypothetical protein
VPNSPAAILDALLALHEAEQGSVFRLMREGSPYVRQVPPELRGRVKELHDINGRHVEELAGVIRRLGGVPQPRPALDDPYIQFLSARFLIPKLLSEKELMRERYDNTLGALPESAPGDIVDLLRRQEAEQAAHVDALAAAAGPALAGAT